MFNLYQAPIEFESVDVTPVVGLDGKTQIPAEAIESVNQNKIGLKGIHFIINTFNVKLTSRIEVKTSTF